MGRNCRVFDFQIKLSAHSAPLRLCVKNKMKSPLFSCVVPVKGDRPFFCEAVESLKAQGMGDNLEIIVQDADVEPDSGQSDALNKGFAKAKGEWLFWLNADDVLLPGVLIKVKQLLHSSTPPLTTLNWIAGDTVYLDEKGIAKDVRTDAKWRSWFGKKLSVWTGGPSAFFRRELWAQRGGFDVGLKYAMDIDLWTRWAKAGERFVELGDYVWGFRVHGGSQTMNGENFAAQIAERRAIDAKYGVSSDGFWRNVTRLASVLDGSWRKRKRDSRAMKGLTVEELRGVCEL